MTFLSLHSHFEGLASDRKGIALSWSDFCSRWFVHTVAFLNLEIIAIAKNRRWTPEIMNEDLNFSNKKEDCTRTSLITTDKIPASFLFLSRTIKSLIGDLSTEFTDLSTVFRCLSLVLSEFYGFR